VGKTNKKEYAMGTLKNKQNFKSFKVKELLMLTIKKNPADPVSSAHETLIGACKERDYKAALADFARNKKTKFWSMPGKVLLLTNGKTGYFLVNQAKVTGKKKLSAEIKKLVKR
jgi:hypothetical protein